MSSLSCEFRPVADPLFTPCICPCRRQRSLSSVRHYVCSDPLREGTGKRLCEVDDILQPTIPHYLTICPWHSSLSCVFFPLVFSAQALLRVDRPPWPVELPELLLVESARHSLPYLIPQSRRRDASSCNEMYFQSNQLGVSSLTNGEEGNGKEVRAGGSTY